MKEDCPVCRRVERDLQAKGIHVVSIDIETNPMGIQVFPTLGAGDPPVARVKGQVVAGNTKAILEALEKSKQKQGS